MEVLPRGQRKVLQGGEDDFQLVYLEDDVGGDLAEAVDGAQPHLKPKQQNVFETRVHTFSNHVAFTDI